MFIHVHFTEIFVVYIYKKTPISAIVHIATSIVAMIKFGNTLTLQHLRLTSNPLQKLASFILQGQLVILGNANRCTSHINTPPLWFKD